jgi:predicted methyltransferase
LPEIHGRALHCAIDNPDHKGIAMKSLPLILAAGLLASASAAAMHHTGGKQSEHGKMSAEQMQAHHLEMLQETIKGSWRDPKNTVRDQYRRPYGTLGFFGVTPHSHVMEIWPGGGWYAEILVPYATHHGSYTGAVNNPNAFEKESTKAYYLKQNTALREKFAGNPEIYGKAKLLEFDPAAPVLGKPGSMDVVLTFRNVHNWRMAKQAEGMFKAFYAVLKKGGTLGVVEHRADKDVAEDDKSGYVSEAQVIALAKNAGFVLDGRSELNANALDTKDYPGGVWTLPPTLREGDKDRAKYLAIGESDRMTLRFKKP